MKTKFLFSLTIFSFWAHALFAQCSTPITGPSNVCEGTGAGLSNATTGGTWSASAGTGSGTIDASTGLFNGVSAGTVNVTYTVGGCTYYYTVTVNPAPSISGSVTVGVGGSVSYGTTVGGGTWFIADPSIATESGGVVTGVSAGSTYLYYETPAGCKTNYAITVVNCSYPISGPSSVCVGGAISLTDADPSPGTWTSSTADASVGSSSGIVTGVSVGSTTITYTTASGCVYTHGVSVGDVPTGVSASATPNPLCTGSSLTLSGAATGATSYSWAGPNSYSSTDMNPAAFTVSTLSAGVYTFTATNSCGGTVAYTSPVVVDVTPVGGTISGTTPVCRNVPTALTTTGTPGGTWTSSNTTYATVNSSTGVVTGATLAGLNNPAPHTVTITYTISNTCGSASSTFNIRIKGTPHIGGGPWTCTLPDVHTLTGTPANPTYGSGSWTCSACSSVTTATPTYNTGTISASATGGTGMATYTYTYTNPSDANYCSGSVSVAVGAVAFPTLTVTGTNVLSTTGGGSCAPTSAGLHVSGGSALGYTWSPSSSAVTNISCTACASPTVSAVTTGTQVYTVTNYGSYCTVPATKTYTITVGVCKPGREDGEALNEASQQDILVIPNPSNGRFTLTLPVGIASAAVTVTDISGKIVQTKITSSDKTDFDMSGYPAGMYMITVSTNDKKYHAKVLKE